MRLSWRLGRVFGINVFLHPSALLWLVMLSWAGANPVGGLVLVGALFGSILLHELGHALMARRYGIGTVDITLSAIGGIARLERMPRSAGPELLIVLAGPAVNAAIALVLTGVAVVSGVGLGLDVGLLVQVIALNVWLMVFNLVPMFPTDGGRILRAALTGPLGRLRATEIAAAVGQFGAVAFGCWCLVTGNWLGAVLAIYLYGAAGMELAQVRHEARAAGRWPGGLIDLPAAHPGFRWADRGDGVWRQVPIFGPGRRSWT